MAIAKDIKEKEIKKALVLDWDGTLFDIRALKKMLVKDLHALGYGRALIANSMIVAIRNGGYSPETHAAILHKEAGGPRARAAKAIWDICKRSSELVFGDVKPFLKRARAAGFALLILSGGNRKFQNAKIKWSGLLPFFDQVHVVRSGRGVTGDNKLKVLKKIARRYQEFIFIDDDAQNIEIAGVCRDFECSARVYVMDRYGRNLDTPFPILRSLRGADPAKL